jgi:hypothetical protein
MPSSAEHAPSRGDFRTPEKQMNVSRAYVNRFRWTAAGRFDLHRPAPKSTAQSRDSHVQRGFAVGATMR